MANTYKGIEFAEGYNRSLAEFKEDFASTHIFKDIPSANREAELIKAYKIATSGNGELPSTTDKSKEIATGKAAKGSV